MEAAQPTLEQKRKNDQDTDIDVALFCQNSINLLEEHMAKRKPAATLPAE